MGAQPGVRRNFMHKDHQTISVKIWAGLEWVPLAQAVVEKSCPVFGLDREQTTRLTVAVEEIVAHLAETTAGTAICLDMIPGGWQVTASLSFAADPSDLWAMNLYAKPDLSGDQDLGSLGLVLALPAAGAHAANPAHPGPGRRFARPLPALDPVEAGSVRGGPKTPGGGKGYGNLPGRPCQNPDGRRVYPYLFPD